MTLVPSISKRIKLFIKPSSYNVKNQVIYSAMLSTYKYPQLVQYFNPAAEKKMFAPSVSFKYDKDRLIKNCWP